MPAAKFHLELRRAIAERGLTLDRLQHHLSDEGVSVGKSTLSVWQSGRRRPTGPESLAAVSALERVLGLPAGRLTTLLDAAELPRPQGTEMGRALPAETSQIDEMFAAVGCPDILYWFSPRASFTRLRLSPEGAIAQLDFDMVLRARRSASRYAILVSLDGEIDVNKLESYATAGGRLGRVLRSQENNAIVSEIVLSQPVRRGELVSLRHTVTNGNPQPATEHVKYTAPQQAISLLELQFHPDRTPTSIMEFARRTPDGPDLQSRPLAVGPDLRAVSIQEGGRRRVCGVRWTYD